jgi:hypothetical protein
VNCERGIDLRGERRGIAKGVRMSKTSLISISLVDVSQIDVSLLDISLLHFASSRRVRVDDCRA